MAPDRLEAPDLEVQDRAEVLDETHLNEDLDEFATFEDVVDVYDATSALGDGREVIAAGAADLDVDGLDDEDLEEDEDLDDDLDDDLVEDEFETETVADLDEAPEADDDAPTATPDSVPDDADPHQDELLDEGIEETFPASDPVSVKRIT